MNKKTLIVLLSLSCLAAQAGDESCNCTVADIEKELSYLAKQLLKVTGEDSHTISQQPSAKASFGACFKVVSRGVKLTCITPDLDPESKGLMIDDVITAINDIDFTTSDQFEKHQRLHQITDNMRAGDVLKVHYTRAKQSLYTEIVVGELKHPGYTFEVTR